MKQLGLLCLSAVAVGIVLAMAGCGGGDSQCGGPPIYMPDPTASQSDDGTVETQATAPRRIVVFKPGTRGSERAAAVRNAGGEVLADLRLVHGVAARLPEAAARRLAARADVQAIEIDHQRQIFAKGGRGRVPSPSPAPAPEQTLEWNIDRVDAEAAHAAGFTGAGVKLAIMDTGVGPHPDLNVVGGFNAANPRKPNEWQDSYGHGTHCAGIAAALDNGFGVVGVAPDVRLYSVRVADKRQQIYDSYIIAGLQWCIDNGIQVVSMSFGGPDPGVLGEACQAAADAGLILVAAAGNEYGAVCYPAAFSSVIAVSATDRDDQFGYFCNSGPEVELAAPGLYVRSTCVGDLDYGGDGYEVLSGTSMATPHVAAAACLAIQRGAANVREVLRATADDLGAAGRDPLFGFGLVDAEEAATNAQFGDDLPSS